MNSQMKHYDWRNALKLEGGSTAEKLTINILKAVVSLELARKFTYFGKSCLCGNVFEDEFSLYQRHRTHAEAATLPLVAFWRSCEKELLPPPLGGLSLAPTSSRQPAVLLTSDSSSSCLFIGIFMSSQHTYLHLD
ncbi:hypothetical protein OUZ56_016785 [Daphnia magna]|uniref:C2H2-type domain-containing protein n=1 Tax=Daphnia magna TaxID=35525 RepID=A0ABR0ARK0_9CRUS|nr:hypothetical protein OUZ56_016785 [Daphnia magna]